MYIKVCNACGGKGTILVHKLDPSLDTYSRVQKTCNVCGGTGESGEQTAKEARKTN